MTDLIDRAFASFQGLRQEAFIRRRLPTEVIESIEQLTKAFASAKPKEREEIVKRVQAPFRFVFESYAFYSAAQEAIRRNDPALVKRGLIALAIQNASPDWRDTLPFLAVLYRSACKLGLDTRALFHEVAEIACPAFRGLLDGFMSCDEQNRMIESFHLIESGEGDTFAYEFVPRPGLKITGEGDAFAWEFVPPSRPLVWRIKSRWGKFFRHLKKLFPGIMGSG